MARSRREQQEVDLEHIRARYRLLERVIPVLYIAALYIPIRTAQPIVNAIAGRHTDFQLSIGISIAYSAAVTVGGGAMYVKTRAQKAEITRLQNRLHAAGLAP